MPAILPLLWANRELIVKGLGIILLALVVWWFGFHNPKVIKDQAATISEKQRQIELRDNTINLLGTIERAHDDITAEENENLRKIRSGRKPPRTGWLILNGMLPAVYKGYSAR